MCKMCDEGKPQDHSGSRGGSRRDFLKTSAAAGAAAGTGLFSARSEATQDDEAAFRSTGRPGHRLLIRGGHVMSMDPASATSPRPTCWSRARRSSPSGRICASRAPAVIDARGRIVMPGFVDTHHHQFETALRSFLADGLLFNDGTPHGTINYFEYILLKFAPVYRPQDVYINELFGGLSQLDGGVTTVHDISQIHHSPAHSDAAIKGLADSGRRAVFGYFESAGARCRQPVSGGRAPHQAAVLLLRRPARHHDHGRRDLPAGLRGGVGDRARARHSRRGAHRRHVRHAARPSTRSPRPTSSAPTTCSST